MALKKERQSNIELLRIIAILEVFVIHYRNADIGGGYSAVAAGSANYYIMNIVEALCTCAVDLFILISAFFMSVNNTRRIDKPIQLILS